MISSSTGDGGDLLLRGDASDTFAFVQFWPDVAHKPISVVCDAFYSIFTAIGLCTPFSAEDVDLSNEQAAVRGEGGLPNLLNPSGGSSGKSKTVGSGEKRADAERRRALALRALDQRLQAASVRQATAGSDVDQSGLGETSYEPEESDRRADVRSES